jgi:hypothetical protein
LRQKKAAYFDFFGQSRGKLRMRKSATRGHGMHHLPDGSHLRVIVLRGVSFKLAADLNIKTQWSRVKLEIKKTT